MGEIYIIENNVNDKKYIGATRRGIETRIKNYRKAYNNPNIRDYNYKICKAMRDIGFDNFTFKVIEECDDDKLDEREKYWIKYYNSTITGYNDALGGKGKPLWTEKMILACKELYEQGWLLEDIAEVFHSNAKVIGKKLRSTYGIQTRKNSINQTYRISVICERNDKSYSFDSKSDAAKYLINNQYTQSHNVASVINKISRAVDNDQYTAYGFKWRSK